MFGYIRIAKPELKVKEYDTYKAVYCSLCRELGKNYGFFARLTLSYDFTFLALLQLALRDGCDGFERKRCVCNPLKKCQYCTNAEFIKMPAAAAMILLYDKLKDNLVDEKGLKKLGNRLLLPLFSRAMKKAARAYPELETIFHAFIEEQQALEQADCKELDRAAEPTAKVLSKLLQLLSDDPAQKRVLDRMGYCLGRYIYLMDAACDLSDDIKTGSYNVLKAQLTGDPKTYAKERVTPQLYICMNEATRAFELLDVKKYKPILGNILYFGLEETMKKEFQT